MLNFFEFYQHVKSKTKLNGDFAQFFALNETKEQKELANEFTGNPAITQQIQAVIPQNQNYTDSLLVLAAYYYAQNKNLEQIKKDVQDYVELIKNNIKVPLPEIISKKPSMNYIQWTQLIHGHQAERQRKVAKSSKPSGIDFQNERPIMQSSDGKIRVYKANSPQQCIILGRGQSFCISQPGNTMWKSYRDTSVSTFYFVYDDTRKDDLSIVVIDVQGNGNIVLTDKNNTTGRTLNPATGQRETGSQAYLKYLTEKGIDVSKLINEPKTEQEKQEDEKLGYPNEDLNYFIDLSHDDKSKYIGRGHRLTDEQFDYIWNNQFKSLIEQYSKTGLRLSDYQIDKIASNTDFRKNYIHNRLIAIQHRFDLTLKEWNLLNAEQKKAAAQYANVYDAIYSGNLELVKYLVEKGAKIPEDSVYHAMRYNNLDIVKYLVEKGAKTPEDAVNDAILYKNLDIVKYFVEKGAEIPANAVRDAIIYKNLDIVKYLVDEKGAKIPKNAVHNAIYSGNLELVKYLVEKGAEIPEDDVNYAIKRGYRGYLDIANYLKTELEKRKHE